MKPETNTLTNTVSAADIARLIMRTPAGVRKTIARLGIEPVHKVGKIRLYPASSKGAVDSAMRKRNLTN